jgi:hypothetical protein
MTVEDIKECANGCQWKQPQRQNRVIERGDECNYLERGEVNGLYLNGGVYRICTVFILKTLSILLNQNKASPKHV